MKCEYCGDKGYVIIDEQDDKGEHTQRESHCECQLSGEE